MVKLMIFHANQTAMCPDTHQNLKGEVGSVKLTLI